MDGIRIITPEEHQRRAKIRDEEVVRERELAEAQAQKRKAAKAAK